MVQELAPNFIGQEERRERLLSCAAALFAAQGYHGTRTADIARQYGFSEPAIYRHFSGKEDIAIEVIDRSWEIYNSLVTSQLGDREKTGDRIEALLDAEKEFYGQPEGRVCYTLLGGAGESEKLREALRQFFVRKTDLYQKIANDDYVAFRLSVLIGIGCLAIVQGQQVFDATIDQLRKEFGAAASSDPGAPTKTSDVILAE